MRRRKYKYCDGNGSNDGGQESWKETPYSPQIEGSKVKTVGFLNLIADQARNQEAGYDKEYVNPHETAGKPWNAEVKQHNGHDGDGA